MELKHVDPQKRKRFLIGLVLAVLIITAFSYFKFSADGILSRSIDALGGTEWIAWSGESLSFADTSVYYQTKEEGKSYPYEERVGVVELLDGNNVYKVFLRFSSERLITSDGRQIFYLKSALPEPEEEDSSDEQD